MRLNIECGVDAVTRASGPEWRASLYSRCTLDGVALRYHQGCIYLTMHSMRLTQKHRVAGTLVDWAALYATLIGHH